jgi:hypothetical protein
MNGSLRETTLTTRTRRITWTGADERPRIEAKELGILLTRGRNAFETVHGRQPEWDNDYWLEWGDETIAFCFAEPDQEVGVAGRCYDPRCNDSTWDHDCPTPKAAS